MNKQEAETIVAIGKLIEVSFITSDNLVLLSAGIAIIEILGLTLREDVDAILEIKSLARSFGSMSAESQAEEIINAFK